MRTAAISPRTGDLTGALAAPIACGACLLAGAAYVAAADPTDSGGVGVCPSRALTGQWCPGCGLTRALHHLARADVAAALSYNLLAPFVIAAMVAGWWIWMRWAAGRGGPTWLGRVPVPVWAVGAVVLVAFAVLRNVPGWEWLRGG